MTFIDERPDVSVAALQALNSDFRYFNVAGSGPTFPVAQRAAETYRSWMNGVGMFSHVGYDSYNAELSAKRGPRSRSPSRWPPRSSGNANRARRRSRSGSWRSSRPVSRSAG